MVRENEDVCYENIADVDDEEGKSIKHIAVSCEEHWQGFIVNRSSRFEILLFNLINHTY